VLQFEMGAQTSNTSNISTTVENAILNSTNATVSNENDNFQSMDGNTFNVKNCCSVNAGQVATQSNSTRQYGVVANASQAISDISQALLQSASSDVSGYGIGVASANNFSSMLASVTTNVTNKTKQTLQNFNNSSQSITNTSYNVECPFTFATLFGACTPVNLGQVVSQMNDNDQSLNQNNDTEVATTISQTADQTASAAVSGINFTVFAVIAGIVLVIIIMASMKKGDATLMGGYNGNFTRNALMVMIIGLLLTVSGILSVATRAPCSMDGHCKTRDWFNTGQCSCINQYECAVSGLDHQPISGVAPPLMFLADLDSGTNQVGALYPTNLNRASVMGWVFRTGQSNPDAQLSNNSGYNLKTYQQMYEYAVGKGINSGRTFLLPLLQYMYRKIHTEDGATYEPDGAFAPEQYLYIPRNQSKAAQVPCVAEMVMAVLPIQPYLLPKEFVKHSTLQMNKFVAHMPVNRVQRRRFLAERRKQIKLQKKQQQRDKRRRTKVKLSSCIGTETFNGAANVVGSYCWQDATVNGTTVTKFRRRDPGTTCGLTDGWRQIEMGEYAQERLDNDESNNFLGGSTSSTKCYILTGAWPDSRIDNNRNNIYGLGSGNAEQCATADDNVGNIEYCGLNSVRVASTFGDNNYGGNWLVNSDSNGSNTTAMGLTFGVVQGDGRTRKVPTCHHINNNNSINETAYIAKINDTAPFTLDPSIKIDSSNWDISRSRADAQPDITGSTSGNALCREALGYADAENPDGVAPTMTSIRGGAYTSSDRDAHFPVMACSVTVSRAEVCEMSDDGSTAVPIDVVNNAAGVRVCEGTDPSNLKNCWTPALCAHHGGFWSVADCQDNDRVDCYGGSGGAYCNQNPSDVCGPGQCMVCNRTQCGNAAGCAWDSDSDSCQAACDPATVNCCNCEKGECAGVCAPSNSGRCVVGNGPCPGGPGGADDGSQGLGGENDTTCPRFSAEEDTQYLVVLPDNFRTDRAGGSNTGCMPNVFVPNPNSDNMFVASDAFTGFEKEDGAFDTGDFLNCTASTTGSDGLSNFANNPQDTYNVNCRYETNNKYGATGCYGSGETETVDGVEYYTWNTTAITNDPRCVNVSSPEQFVASTSNEFSCWVSAQGSDEFALTMYYMFVRITQWLIMYSRTTNNTEYMLSVLGASTLMNGGGLDNRGKPVYDLTSRERIQEMIDNNPWAKMQPLLFKENDGTFSWYTLEDVYGKHGSQDTYIKQISMFIYDRNASSDSVYGQDYNAIARNGLTGSNGDFKNLEEVAAAVQSNTGTLMGAYGYCTNLFNNPIFTGVCFGLAALMFIIMFLIVFLKKKTGTE
jgi:hypothetical protein